MVDIHCHILPGIDDGPATLEESLNLAKQAVAEGLRTVIATPHFSDKFDNPAERVQEAVAGLQAALDLHNIPLKVLAGQEIRLSRSMLDDLDQGRLLTLADTRYILIEVPSVSVPDYAGYMFHELRVMNFIPVIAHPERNKQLCGEPALLFSFIQDGALAQVTAKSLLGGFGRKIQKHALDMCRQNLAHFIASDAHDVRARPFVYEKLRQHLGHRFPFLNDAMANAELMLNGAQIQPTLTPQPRKKKFWLF